MKFVRSLFLAGFATLAGLAPALTAAPTLTQPIPQQSAAVATTVNLQSYFGYSGATGQLVEFDTDYGKFDVELLSDDAPQSVANFLSYVNDGSYNNTIIHRSLALSDSGNRIIQGGGFTQAIPPGVVTTKAAIPLEYKQPNARGTIAFARLPSDANSATSQWFINVDDNSTLLGSANGGGYAVFGRVVGDGMTVVNRLAQVPSYNFGSPLDYLPLQNWQTDTAVQAANLVTIRSITTLGVYPEPNKPSLLTFSATSADPALVTATISGSTLTLTPGTSSGATTVTVVAKDASGASAQSTFEVLVGPQVPVITSQPSSLKVTPGTTTLLRVEATGTALSYQWKRDGADIGGATAPTLLIAADGSYTVTVSNSAGTATSAPALITSTDTTNVGRLVNLSIRTDAGTAEQTLIVGFVVGGGTGAAKPLLLRGVGPTLGNHDVIDFLPDPRLQVIDIQSGATMAENDNWGGDSAIATMADAVGAFPLASPISTDAALVFSPAAGIFTAKVVGASSASGIVLAEIYDATPTDSFTAETPRLMNVSARAQVGTGAHLLIAGFVIGGDTARTVLIRGVGPSLAGAGVSKPLADPQLGLFNGAGVKLAGNDNWGGEAMIKNVASRVGASALGGDDSKDAALLVTLAPGIYTAQVTGVGGTTGVGLVEVYEVK